MEKFYIVTPESELYNEYNQYRKNMSDLNEIAKPLMIKYGIETTLYVPTEEYFYIQPTNNDKEKFSKHLKNPNDNNLYAFKKSSVIGKEWIQNLKLSGLKILTRPLVQFYFDVTRGRYRLFHIENTIYVSYQSEYDFANPKGFEEIKASEFFKIIEENNKVLV